ncbi:MAG TPA: hypothetical protein VNT75_12095 [Symbiobacteriaceae bacterium]|nr:hypothetical protein [Symbiobacteriaceae bacterium]
MSTTQVQLTDPTLAKIRAILAMEGLTGQAGEVTITLANQPGEKRAFQGASVAVEGPYSVSVSTEDALFLAMRPDGELVVHVGPNTGTLARFSIHRVDGFEYQLSPRETRYAFTEKGTRLSLHVRW